jgi:hypothetical protein
MTLLMINENDNASSHLMINEDHPALITIDRQAHLLLYNVFCNKDPLPSAILKG